MNLVLTNKSLICLVGLSFFGKKIIVFIIFQNTFHLLWLTEEIFETLFFLEDKTSLAAEGFEALFSVFWLTFNICSFPAPRLLFIISSLRMAYMAFKSVFWKHQYPTFFLSFLVIILKLFTIMCISPSKNNHHYSTFWWEYYSAEEKVCWVALQKARNSSLYDIVLMHRKLFLLCHNVKL